MFTVGAGSTAGSVVAIGSLMLYVAAFAVSLGPIFWLLNAEIYPLEVRSKAAAVGTMANWMFNFLVSLTFLLLIDALGRGGAFLFYAGDLRGHVLLLQAPRAGDQGQTPGGHHGRLRAARGESRRDCIALDDSAARTQRLQGARGSPRASSLRATCATCSARPGAGHPARGRGGGLYLDYSKNRITDETVELLVQLADECGLAERRDAMFRGEHINISEDRAVLHVALRMPRGRSLIVDGDDVVQEVHEVLDRMAAFADRVRYGAWTGQTGKRIRNIVNIGIGGSDLGPVMAYEALRYYSRRDLTFRFVSNVDGTDFVEATRDLDPAETLFIVSSKTFTTLETMTNARTAREWSLAGLGGDERRSPSTSSPCRPTPRGSREFGIDTDNMFGFWEWVGGRYSMDSAIGLSTMLAIGPEAFGEMLAGFHAVDEHFRDGADAREPARR